MEFWIGWFHEHSLGDDVKVLAKTMESAGFTGVAISDHIAMPRAQQSRHPIMQTSFDPLTPYVEPFTTAAYMGAVTERLRFMTYSLVSGMREPFSIAKQAAVLSDLTGGRFDLGITPGWLEEEIALLGHDPATRGRRFEETLDVISGLWENDLFSYDGEHYRFEDVGVSPRPAIPPKIYVGGHGKLSLRRAARRHGWIGMIHSADELKEMFTYLDRQGGPADNKRYVIPGEELSTEYIQRMEALGVDGLIIMVWPILDPAFATAQARIAALEKFSDQWIG
jgi:probable F420-dependent oxidoreductase